MNRLQDDYDPYAVEEPSDEEPVLSRWAAAPRLRPALAEAVVLFAPAVPGRSVVRFTCGSLGALDGAAQSLGNQDGQQCGKRDVPELRGPPGVKP